MNVPPMSAASRVVGLRRTKLVYSLLVRKVRKRKPSLDTKVEAVRFLGRWTRLAQGHVLVGGGCSCGVGAASVRLEEFEQQILDYLKGKYAAAGKASSVPALLRAIAADSADDGESVRLLADLDRTMESFEALHRTR